MNFDVLVVCMSKLLSELGECANTKCAFIYLNDVFHHPNLFIHFTHVYSLKSNSQDVHYRLLAATHHIL